MVKKEKINPTIVVEDNGKKAFINPSCERCGTEMRLTGGGPLGSKDYECMHCHAKMTRGG